MARSTNYTLLFTYNVYLNLTLHFKVPTKIQFIFTYPEYLQE